MSGEKAKVKSDKERPIIFNTDMVKAILNGRKIQTRRVIKPQPELTQGSGFKWKGELYGDGLNDERTSRNFAYPANPYGKPGDLLYVRETWMPTSWSENGDDWCIHYKAGGKGIIVPHLFSDEAKERDFWIKISDELHDAGCPSCDGMYEEVDTYMSWKPSIFMPKTAARIWLKVTGVRVERVQDITFNDILDEGLGILQKTEPWELIDKWVDLWDSINSKRGFSWESNPWVWVVEFELISENGRPANE